jgi:hypothetical protein
MGFSLVVFSAGVVRAMAKTARRFYDTLRADGTTDAMRDRMFDFDELARLVGTSAMLEIGQALRGRAGRRGMTLDPVTLAVLKGRLEQIADEMDATLYRSAFNPIIAEARDACHGLYHRDDRRHPGAGHEGPADLRRRHGLRREGGDRQGEAREGGLEPGDTFLFNDPYAGGTHLNDIRLVRPIFRDGELFCWLASAGHWLDIGGNVPGGYNPRATESFQEGVLIPVVKLVAARRDERQDIVDILAANSPPAELQLGRPQRPAQRPRPRREPAARSPRPLRRRRREPAPSTPSPRAPRR